MLWLICGVQMGWEEPPGRGRDGAVNGLLPSNPGVCSNVHRTVPESSRGLTVFEEDSGGQTALGSSPWSPASLHCDGVRVLMQARGKEWPKPREGEHLGCSGPRVGWWAACTGRERRAIAGGVVGRRGSRRARQGRAGWRGRRSGSRWQCGQGHGPGLHRVPAPAPALPLASVPLGGRLASGFRGNAATPALVAPRPAPATGKGCPSRRSEGTRRTVGGCIGGEPVLFVCHREPRCPRTSSAHRGELGTRQRGRQRRTRAVPSRGALGTGGLRPQCSVLQPPRAFGDL